MENLTIDSMTEKLFQRLDNLGIAAPELKEHLNRKIQGDLFNDFETSFQKKYGTDVLRCTLPIEWDPFFKAYKMNRYEVSLSPRRAAAFSSISATEPGCLNLQTAYYCISGKIDDLVEQLIKIGFLRDIHEIEKATYTITQDINESPDGFTMHFIERNKEGTMICKIPIEAKANNLTLKNITATYVIHPEIQHGIFNGVDSREVEAQLQARDWFAADDVDLDHNGLPELKDDILRIYQQLNAMQRDEKGKLTADQLKDTYWLEESFMSCYSFGRVRNQVEAKFSTNISVKEMQKKMTDMANKKAQGQRSPGKRKNGFRFK